MLPDIENELQHYRRHFAGKTVLCNCDDPFESNFFKYFVLNFNRLKIKKLIATSYTGSPIADQELPLFDIVPGAEPKKPRKAIVTEVYDANGDGGIDMLDVAELFKHGKNQLLELAGDGDFRSKECRDLMDEADVVVTNPPFSLFREYVATLMAHGKKFIIMGNQNAITYKEIFPLLMRNEMWLGTRSGHTLFAVPSTYEIPDFYDKNDRQRLRANGYVVDENGKLWRNLGNICWFTNLDHKKRHEELILVPRYDAERYPKYDNYDAIDVSRVQDIPFDYEPGYLVPIEYKQQLIDAGFILGSERKNDSGSVCVCVCGATITAPNCASERNPVLQRDNGGSDNILRQTLSGTVRDIGGGLFTGGANNQGRQRESKPAANVCEWAQALFSCLGSQENAEWCNGIMGVPVTFFDKHNPDQFELLGMTDRNNMYGLTTRVYTKEESDDFGNLNRRGAIRCSDGTLRATYARILIRRKMAQGVS